MIGLDGCFIKTPYGGQLLTAIGWNPNDQILPIAYAAVEAETKDSWRWFFLNLCDDLGVDKIRWCTFMSDQQKGLIPTFDELLPGIDHRFCVRHLYSNFRKRFPGVQLKMMMWKAAKATYVQEWERRMKEIQQVDQGAYNHLIEISAKYWSKSRFNYFPRVDTLVNNMCECFNSVIVEAREKPIVSMLEDIRVYLMNRWSDNRQSIVTYAGEILPKINKKIEREFDKGGEWLAIYAGRDKYEVSISQGNRAKKMCLDVKNYVNKCYRKETYVDYYQHVIYPLNGPNLWSQTENDDVLPPVFRKPIGRPKLRRNKTGDEPRNNGPLSKLARTGQQQKCSYCFALGHNKRTCPRKRKMEAAQNATAQAKKGAGTTRTPKFSKIPAKTTTQPATRVQPKRKSSTQVGGSQESQTSCKRARCSSSASQPQPSTATVTSPSRRTLRFMEKTPPRAWKALG
ncbi:uncharacterized protein LOC110274713 [Arachis duranensis]|uniref:Uncharacterized protein LOC110274713 n=1 Tax=Arachis duranensis TaxID=130453 RepID=A0A9C6WPD8_ARADU|nr:uncharacterized protein LOC110274713 [Arachis duranensis]